LKKNNEKLIIEIAQKIFKYKNININSSVNTISSWDSINHLNLIATIEKKFKIKINFDQSLTIYKLKDIIKIIK
jgi:acyl carrier protein